MFFLISTNFTSTLGIPLTSSELKISSIEGSSGVKLRDFTLNCLTRLRALYAQSFRTTLAPSVLPQLLARNLPVLLLLVPSSLLGVNQMTLLPSRKSFTTQGPSSLTRHRCIRVSSIVQDSPLLPPVGVWAVSQSQCG